VIPFVDLAAQQQRLSDEINARMAAVLAHGRYILGPEVDELEKKLAAFTGATHCINGGEWHGRTADRTHGTRCGPRR
jgi:UDP-2-acetamido-2-deoxy-ribo-hexuluronate aminotransferase